MYAKICTTEWLRQILAFIMTTFDTKHIFFGVLFWELSCLLFFYFLRRLANAKLWYDLCQIVWSLEFWMEWKLVY